MEIIFLLIPLALLFLAGAIAALFWALRKDQFDDLDNAAWRVVFEDREERKQARKKASKEPRHADSIDNTQDSALGPRDDH
ncbi:cbb3-type cytochrome oxidase assembly protein CcoS [Alcanivorax sp.]|uniref:cbb3-type cytochrome oxidase assembly protein CcoS n=1 Tax=Alcanivorax sp. TaxID=1872427 RepID=UPI002B26DCB5|nr:cbb3-type cytochrome oxidase assembly protein CcoS [Alcanivorax sp.]